MRGMLERFLYDLEMKTPHEQNRNKKRTEIEWFDWFIQWIQMHMGFGWLSKWGGMPEFEWQGWLKDFWQGWNFRFWDFFG